MSQGDLSALEAMIGGLDAITGVVIGIGLGSVLASLVHLLRQLHSPNGVAEAVRNERRRIARELHDIVGHRLLAITLHARQLRATTPPAPQVSDAIEDIARETQHEVRRMIGVLHRVDGVAAAGEPVLGEPLSASVVAMSTDLPDLALSLRFENLDHEDNLHAQLRQTALRIVQEGVTNAAKYGTGPVDVRICYGEELELNVVNSNTVAGQAQLGAPPCAATPAAADLPRSGPDTAGGHGLIGLRERVADLGGSLEYGALTDGEFAVRARLPMRALATESCGGMRRWTRSAS